MKCRAPSCHATCRSFTRKLATIMRTRLCIQPSASSWRMPASTTGNPSAPPARPGTASPGVVDRHRPQVRAQSATRTPGPVPQHVGVELAPAQFACGSGRRPAPGRREVGEQRARVDLAVLQVCRQWPTSRRAPGRLRGLVVPLSGRRGTPPPRRAAGSPADGRVRPARSGSGGIGSERTPSAQVPAWTAPALGAGAGRRAPATRGRTREDLERGAPARENVPGPTAYGVPVATSRRPRRPSAARPRRRAAARTARRPR